MQNWKYATFPQRLYAYNIDITVFMLVIIPVAFFVESNFLIYCLSFIAICLYHAIMESSVIQGTLGKKMNGLKVVNDQMERISFGRALLRILFKFLSLLLLFGGFFIIYFRKDRKGLHDLITKTKVISQ